MRHINLVVLFMKQLLTSPDSALTGLARSVLEAAGIPCEIRNESVSQAIVGMPFSPELWVGDEDYDEARRLLAAARRDKSGT